MVKEKETDEVLLAIHDADEAVDRTERAKPYYNYLNAELGLRDHWYPAFFGQELGNGEMMPQTIAGERIYFKRVAGKIFGVEDRCVHRGAAFSSKPECFSENTITCWIHGFTYDVRDGELIEVITEPGSKAIGKMKLKSYPVEEHNGVVFVFIGDLDPPPPLKEDVQPKFWNPGLKFHPLHRHLIKANWRLSCENGYDAAHIYAHRNSAIVTEVGIPLPLGTYSPNKDSCLVYEQDGEAKGVVKLMGDRPGIEAEINVWEATIEGNHVVAQNVDLDNPPPGVDIDVGLFMPCGLEVDWFPQPGMIHFEWYVPVDEENHMYMITQSRYCSTEEEERQFHEECETSLGPLVWKEPAGQTAYPGDGATWGFNNFDQFGRAHMEHVYAKENWWNRERLTKADYIIVRWRMLVHHNLRGIQKRGDWANTGSWDPENAPLPVNLMRDHGSDGSVPE